MEFYLRILSTELYLKTYQREGSKDNRSYKLYLKTYQMTGSNHNRRLETIPSSLLS